MPNDLRSESCRSIAGCRIRHALHGNLQGRPNYITSLEILAMNTEATDLVASSSSQPASVNVESNSVAIMFDVFSGFLPPCQLISVTEHSATCNGVRQHTIWAGTHRERYPTRGGLSIQFIILASFSLASNSVNRRPVDGRRRSFRSPDGVGNSDLNLWFRWGYLLTEFQVLSFL